MQKVAKSQQQFLFPGNILSEKEDEGDGKQNGWIGQAVEERESSLRRI